MAEGRIPLSEAVDRVAASLNHRKNAKTQIRARAIAGELASWAVELTQYPLRFSFPGYSFHSERPAVSQDAELDAEIWQRGDINFKECTITRRFLKVPGEGNSNRHLPQVVAKGVMLDRQQVDRIWPELASRTEASQELIARDDPGPLPKGKRGREEIDDSKLLEEMLQLRRDEVARSNMKAAKLVADKATGNSRQAIIRRLSRKFKDLHKV